MSEADYIAVLDTGSTDGTYELLQEFAKNQYKNKLIVSQKIFNPWRFDVARNESLKLIPEDVTICFCTDMDELLDAGWANILREKWKNGFHEKGTYKYIWSHLRDGVTPARVFFHDKIHSRNWNWKYPVHEVLQYTNFKKADVDVNTYINEHTISFFDDICIHHYPVAKSSRKNYLPLLELRAQEFKGEYLGLIYLGHEYFYQQKYEDAIATLYKILYNHSEEISPIEKANCYLFLGDSYKMLGAQGECERMYIKAIDADPSYREPYLNIAKILIERHEYNSAIFYLKTALKNTYRHYIWLEQDASWSYELYDLLSISCFYTGDKLGALAYAAKAYHENNSDKRLEDNVKTIIQTMRDEDFL